MAVYRMHAPKSRLRNTKNIGNREFANKIDESKFCAVCRDVISESVIHPLCSLGVARHHKPYAPGHLMIVPFMHINSLFDVDPYLLREVIFIHKVINEKHRYHMFVDEGLVAGQENSHITFNLVPEDFMNNNFCETYSRHMLLADPLSAPVIIESGLVPSDYYEYRMRVGVEELYSFLQYAADRLLNGFARVVESPRHSKLSSYGIKKRFLRDIAWLYCDDEYDKMNDIDFLLEKVHSSKQGYGFNIYFENTGFMEVIVHIVPRVTPITGNGKHRFIGGMGMFLNTLLNRKDFSDDEYEQWHDIEDGYLSTILL